MSEAETNSAAPADEVAAALARAREAQPAWSALTSGERAKKLLPLKKRLLRRADEIATTLTREAKKPHEEALLAEVLPNADLVDYWTRSIEELLAPELLELDPIAYPGKSGRVLREARGIVALITPWNYPVAIPLRTLLPALVSGNAVLFKPSEHAKASGALVASLFEGLLPSGVLELCDGDGVVGAALVDADVDAVVFTGSVATGRKVATACAARLIPCSLELGGKDAAIVLDDAPLERTARGLVWGAFTNAGQNCASIERVYVVSAIAEALTERVVALTRELVPGRDIGSLTTAAQARLVRRQLVAAVAGGAEVACGGVPEEGATEIAPTVLKVTDEESELMQEETFGPVLPIVVVADEDEAIRRANASKFGLTVSVWTKRVSRSDELARKLRSGVLTINNHGFTAALPAAPWSGIKLSGFGVTNGPHALSALVRPRLVLEDRNRAKSELWWYPYTKSLREVAESMAVLRGGGGIIARVRAFFTLLGALPRRLMGRP
jgi:acyl-CoA reductase-like NAD-dependent aldehyde dehydrogenase